MVTNFTHPPRVTATLTICKTLSLLPSPANMGINIYLSPYLLPLPPLCKRQLAAFALLKDIIRDSLFCSSSRRHYVQVFRVHNSTFLLSRDSGYPPSEPFLIHQRALLPSLTIPRFPYNLQVFIVHNSTFLLSRVSGNPPS